MLTTLFFSAAFAADPTAVPSEATAPAATAAATTPEAVTPSDTPEAAPVTVPARGFTATHLDLPGYHGTNLAPDARPAESTFSAAGGAMGASFLSIGAVGANARLTWAPSAHFELSGETVLGVGDNVIGYSSLTARSSIPLGDSWFIGPWVGGGTTWGDGSGWSDELGHVLLGGGVAVSGGSEKVGFDASIPIAIVEVRKHGVKTDEAFTAFLGSEAHVSVQVAPRHTIRAGFDSFFPGVGYQYDNGHVFVGAQLHSLIYMNVARAEVGFRM